ncbi:MAG: aspartate kinase [Candidatus Cloacimonetes bacterium]|nr:aspartate kinase [Candidatus Cloacimonadota bacterium]
MQIVVKKFGGSSLNNIDRVKKVAELIAIDQKDGEQIIAVVSAMGKTTNELIKQAYSVSSTPSRRELDMLMTAGERITMSLLSIALLNLGVDSISLTGSQCGIITDTHHGNAKIIDVRAFRMNEALKQGKVVIVAGFQGVSKDKEVTTLGRGGSDTTAVALASYLKATRCEIYTDVRGVFSANPHWIPKARLLPEIDAAQMLIMSYSGSTVLHPRAVEFAIDYERPVVVKSSFGKAGETVIVPEETRNIRGEELMEDRVVTSITSQSGLFGYQIYYPEGISRLFNELNRSGLDVFSYEFIDSERINVFIEREFREELETLATAQSWQIEPLYSSDGMGEGKTLAAITLVGIRLWNNLGIMSSILNLLEQQSIPMIRFHHTYSSVSFYVAEEFEKKLVKRLHREYITER